MALGPGSRIGTYEILSALGAGGMGAVYRARDTKLGRDVAIKILPDAFAADAERQRLAQPELRAHALDVRLAHGMPNLLPPARGKR